MSEAICPINGDYHKLFVAKTYEIFEPHTITKLDGTLYKRVEWAIMSCNCSEIIRVEIKNGNKKA